MAEFKPYKHAIKGIDLHQEFFHLYINSRPVDDFILKDGFVYDWPKLTLVFAYHDARFTVSPGDTLKIDRHGGSGPHSKERYFDGEVKFVETGKVYQRLYARDK